MKINGQYPKIQSQDKNVTKSKEKEALDRGLKGASQKTEEAIQNPTSEFVVNRIRQKIQAEPDINLAKVNELKARIKAGDYKVDPEKLAGKMLNEALMEDIT